HGIVGYGLSGSAPGRPVPGHLGARTGPRSGAGGLPPAPRPLCRRALGGRLCPRRTDRRGPAAVGAGGGTGGGDALPVGPCTPDGLAERGISAGWPPE